jgi:hypothetical protein
MRALLVVATLLTLAFGVKPVAAIDYPWCVHYSMQGEVTNCGFTSWEQCRQTASGAGGFCAPNPFYATAQAAARARPKPQKRSDR